MMIYMNQRLVMANDTCATITKRLACWWSH